MELTHGTLTAQYIVDPCSWRIYDAKRDLVALAHPEDWANDDVDFRSHEAGQMYLAQIAELCEAFDEPVEGEMVKNDQGVTKDVPDTSPETTVCPGEDMRDCGPDSPAMSDQILSLIQELLDLADVQGPSQEIVAAIDELNDMYKYAMAQEVEHVIDLLYQSVSR